MSPPKLPPSIGGSIEEHLFWGIFGKICPKFLCFNRDFEAVQKIRVLPPTVVSIFIPGSWASFSCFCGARRKLLRSPWNLVVCNLRSIQNSSRLSDGCIFFISRHSGWFSPRIDYYICLHLWNLGKEKTQPFTSLKVFVAFDSTKLCRKQQKQNKLTLSFLLHQKSSKFIY